MNCDCSCSSNGCAEFGEVIGFGVSVGVVGVGRVAVIEDYELVSCDAECNRTICLIGNLSIGWESFGLDKIGVSIATATTDKRKMSCLTPCV